MSRDQLLKLGQEETRRRCLLGRLGGVAESIWMYVPPLRLSACRHAYVVLQVILGPRRFNHGYSVLTEASCTSLARDFCCDYQVISRSHLRGGSCRVD